MRPTRKVFVVGAEHSVFLGKKHPDFVWKKHPDFGKRENPTLEEHLATALKGVLERFEIDARHIDKGYVGNFIGALFANQAHMGALVPRILPELEGKPFARTEAACASGGIALTAAVDALSAGCDVALAAGAEVQTTVSAREGADYLARAAHYESERGLDEFTFPCMFARRSKIYKDTFGVSDEDIAHVTVKAYENASKNPYAHMRAVRMDLASAAAASDANPNFLQNEEFKDHLKMSDCSQVSDGASALILATEEGLAKLGKKPEECVELLSYGVGTGALGKVSDYTVLGISAGAAAEAYRDAGVGPDEMRVAEVHDCFAVTELLMYEALGFAERGKGSELAQSGATALDGRLPVNTGGGLIAFGHPVGATGVKQVGEIFRQMKGLCGDYQVAGTLEHGISANMGGDDRTSVVTVLRNLG